MNYDIELESVYFLKIFSELLTKRWSTVVNNWDREKLEDKLGRMHFQ